MLVEWVNASINHGVISGFWWKRKALLHIQNSHTSRKKYVSHLVSNSQHLSWRPRYPLCSDRVRISSVSSVDQHCEIHYEIKTKKKTWRHWTYFEARKMFLLFHLYFSRLFTLFSTTFKMYHWKWVKIFRIWNAWNMGEWRMLYNFIIFSCIYCRNIIIDLYSGSSIPPPPAPNYQGVREPLLA